MKSLDIIAQPDTPPLDCTCNMINTIIERGFVHVFVHGFVYGCCSFLLVKFARWSKFKINLFDGGM